MKLSELHLKWRKIHSNKTKKESLCFCNDIINKLWDSYQILNDKGIYEEKRYINSLVILTNLEEQNINRIRVERFCETAFMIWALQEINRKDIIENVISNWGSGSDEDGTSHYRNFEYECHVALRFLEENYSIKLITDNNEVEFLVDNNFGIECKRPGSLYGVFKNTLKAKKQIENSKKPGFILFNLDNLDVMKNLNTDDQIYRVIRNKVLEASILGLKNNEEYVEGVIFEYNPINQGSSSKGSIIYAITTNHKAKFKTSISKALTGGEELNFNKIRNRNRNVYKNQFKKNDNEKMKSFFTKNFNM